MPLKSLTGFFQRLRLSDPFNYKIPLLMGIPYLMVIIYGHDFLEVMCLMAASIITCLGFAGFGYATNDWSDIEKDQLANKSNAFAALSLIERIGIVLLFLVLAIAPWLYLPWDEFSLLLFVVELLLFAAYAFPPFRLKERGIWGVIADALYAHAIPALFAAYTFYLFDPYCCDHGPLFLGSRSMSTLIGSLVIWQFVAGIRNIINHQIEDFGNDKAGSTNTFIMRIGIDKGRMLIKILIPLEVLLLILFLFLSGHYTSYWLGMFYLVVGVLLLLVNRQQLKDLSWKKFSIFVLEDFYLECIPVCILLLLMLMDYRFLLLLLLHILIFPKNIITHAVKNALGK